MTTKSSEDENRNHTIGLATEIVSSFVSNNSLPAAALPDLIRSVATVLNEVSKVTTPKLVKRAPAVAIKHSITDEHVICLEDGKKLKMLKRYLRTKYNLTPDEYRQKWGLPANYICWGALQCAVPIWAISPSRTISPNETCTIHSNDAGDNIPTTFNATNLITIQQIVYPTVTVQIALETRQIKAKNVNSQVVMTIFERRVGTFQGLAE